MPGRFTFHYISILMIAYISDISPHHSFTFHHVSILIWIPENFNYAVNDNTPSSILLYVPLCFHFNRVPSRLFQCFYDLYIPLCLYFNHNDILLRSAIILIFTFHYVSILIVAAFAERAIPTSFTFHYVFILIQTTSSSRCLKIIYIPLCLYFNWKQQGTTEAWESDLHSIMF